MSDVARATAARALQAWGIADARLTLVCDRDNTTFAVEIGSERRYALRLCRAHALRVSRTARELAWMRALRRDTAMTVAAPLGLHIDPVEGRVCAAVEWLEGDTLAEGTVTRSDAHQIGVAVATLHQHAARWPVAGATPAEPIRPYVPRDDSRVCAFTRGEAAVIHAVRRLQADTLTLLARSRSPYGIIHADVTPSNCIRRPNSVALIDYADTTFGFFAWDLAVFLASVRCRSDHAALAAAFFRGYASCRPRPTIDGTSLEYLVLARLVSQALWLAEHVRDPGFGPGERRRAKQLIAHVRASLATFGDQG